MSTPQLPEKDGDGKEMAPDPAAMPEKRTDTEAVRTGIGKLQDQVGGNVETLEEQPSFSDLVVEIAMRLDYGEILPNEAVAELAILLNRRNLPITQALLHQIGVTQFTLTHEDFARVRVIDILMKKQGEWMIIEDKDMPDEFGLPLDTEEEVGDEMRGMLGHDTEKGFFLHAPDHTLYPLDTAALAALESRGGAFAFVNKEIVVRVDIGDTVRMTVQ